MCEFNVMKEKKRRQKQTAGIRDRVSPSAFLPSVQGAQGSHRRSNAKPGRRCGLGEGEEGAVGARKQEAQGTRAVTGSKVIQSECLGKPRWLDTPVKS